MVDSLFAQPLSKSSVVYLLVWNPPLHTPYISSSNHCLLFATHTHTITTCFDLVPRLCHLFIICLSPLYFELFFTLISHIHLTHSLLCLLKCHIIFFPYKPGLTSMQHTTPHTTAVQSPIEEKKSKLIAAENL